jgi:hypothetical protein
MPGRVEVVLGNMFDRTADLLVIPCSEGGTVTKPVAKRLNECRIPLPPPVRRIIGQVDFVDLYQASPVALAVAYAVSVGRGQTQSSVIERIGAQLGARAAGVDSLRTISAPILGSGAGELDPLLAAVALARGFMSVAPETALLQLFVLSESEFHHIGCAIVEWSLGDGGTPIPSHDSLISNGRDAGRPPRAFLSYSWSDPALKEWVKWVATELRRAGIESRLDVWHVSPGMDLAQWMTNELELADRVLLFCDEAYARKAAGRQGGVGWETRIVQGDLLISQTTNPSKYIPIIASDEAAAGTPAYLKATYCIHWPLSRSRDRGSLETLIKAVYQVHDEAPPIGTPPSFVLGR